MKNILTIFIIILLMKEDFCGINQCPHIQFKSDGNGKYATVTIPPTVISGLNYLKVNLELRDDPTGGRNSLELVKSDDEVVAEIKQGKNIQFKLNFLQSSLSPIITRISLNDKDICSAVEGIGKHKFDIQTTFFLPPLSTPTPSATSQLSAANTSSVQSGDVSWLQSLPSAGTCGRPFQATQTIIGGEEVTEGEYPWMVAMYHYKPEQQDNKKFVCGASLISDTYVITAAHCTKNQTHVHLEFGKFNIHNYYETHYVSRTSSKIISHPNYKNSALGDVALVSFHPPLVTFTQWIVPICLWGNFDSELHQGTVVGWGQQNNNDGAQSITPKKLTVSMVGLNICRDSHVVLQNLARNETFCAGGAGAGPCHGDSGGGFFVAHEYVQYLRGIISHSVGDAERCNVQEYAVYADLAYALDWMQPYLLPDPAAVSVAAQKCEEYKQLRAKMNNSLPEGTSVSQYPHVALLGHGDPPVWDCTGVLISEQFILTSARCSYYYTRGDVSAALLGTTNKRKGNESGTLQFKINQILTHPTRRNTGNAYADIMLLKLARPVKGVVPACLHEDVNIPTDNAQEIGWNRDVADSDLLQVTNVTPSNYAECAAIYRADSIYPKGFDVESQLCATDKGRTICKDNSRFEGDRTGGPVQINDKSGVPNIIGIMSNGLRCPHTLYTRVSYYVRWIESIVWP